MAVIQKLRASGIVVGAVVVALIAFVATDAIKKNGSNSNQDLDVIAQIGGENVKMDELNAGFSKYYMQAMNQLQSEEQRAEKQEEIRKQSIEQAWADLVNARTIDKAIKNSGIEVIDADIKEMFTGQNIDPIAKQIPDFQENGQYSRSKVKQIFSQARRAKGNQKQGLIDFLNSVKKQTSQTRYAAYISKCLKTTTLEKEFEYINSNQGQYANIVSVNYSSINDADVKLTDEDYEEYFESHKYLFKPIQQERDIEYVKWDYFPTAADTAAALKDAQDKLAEYATGTEADTLGVGMTDYVSPSYFPKDTNLNKFLNILYRLPVGGTAGPVYSAGKYYVGRKVKEKPNQNPSVDVSHILISTDPSRPAKSGVTDSIAAKAKAQELLAKVRSGSNFEELAQQYSDDGSSGQGGKLGAAPANNYVPEFADFCKNNKKGAIGLVKTQFGYHIIKVNEDPAGTLAKLRFETVDISQNSEVTKELDAKTTQFVNSINYKESKSFETAYKKMGLTPRVADNILTATKEIPGITTKQDARQIVNWCYSSNRKTGDISNVFVLSDKYIIIRALSVRNMDNLTWKDVKAKMEPDVKKAKKAKMIIEQKFNKYYTKGIQAKDLANKVGGGLIPIENFKASQNYLPTLLKDDKTMGCLLGLSAGKSSIPIEGNQGVNVVFVIKRDKTEIPKAGLGNDQNQEIFNNSDFVLRRVNQALFNQAQVQDYRFRQEGLDD